MSMKKWRQKAEEKSNLDRTNRRNSPKIQNG